MAGQEGDREFIHIVDAPDGLVQRKVTCLTDGSVFVDSQFLVLPIQEVTGRIQTRLSFIGLRTQNRNIYIEAIPVVPLKFIKRQIYFIIILTPVV